MINRKKTQRLYKEEGLAVAPVLALSNQRWSLELGASALHRFATNLCTTRWPQAGGPGCSTWSMT